MSNLSTFNNFYLNLSQSAYEDRPISFYKHLNDVENAAYFDFSKEYKDP